MSQKEAKTYILNNVRVSSLDEVLIQNHSAEIVYAPLKFYDIEVVSMQLNLATFSHSASSGTLVSVCQQEGSIGLSCTCNSMHEKLCRYQVLTLHSIRKNKDYLLFFDDAFRQEKIRKLAESYGLQHEEQPDDFFQVEYIDSRAVIKPRLQGLFPVTKESTSILKENLFVRDNTDIPLKFKLKLGLQPFVVVRQHRFYRHLNMDIYEGGTSLAGKLKNPLTLVDPQTQIWKTQGQEELKFYTGVTWFQNNHTRERSESDIHALKSVFKNPLALKFYQHDPEISEKVNAASLSPITLGSVITDARASVCEKSGLYHIHVEVQIDKQLYLLQDLVFKHGYFIQMGGRLHLVGDLQLLNVFDFFRQNGSVLIIHKSKFTGFKEDILDKLEDRISISYSWVKQEAPKTEGAGKEVEPERIIYLSDSESYVLINPVVKYGDVEVPVLSRRQVYAPGSRGDIIAITRNNEYEDEFTSLLIRQHPFFQEQLDDGLLYFYLHKDRFLKEDWFLTAFDEWLGQGITVLGYNELKGSRINPNKAKISINVVSGLDWFNAELTLRYGQKKASLKQVQKAVRNKHKYVQLDDGTFGILPAEWIEKLSACLQAGEIRGETSLKIPKINFQLIEEMGEDGVLDEAVKDELAVIRSKLSNFKSIESVEVPTGLNAVLRPYQKEGLNWMNFLDEFNFGGCLADDMGLGKSLQIIAFILLQRQKAGRNTNLLVVPTSLIFNWQAEIEKLAPSIRVLTFYGSSRIKDTSSFENYEVILTSYGTLLSDSAFLKSYRFNYIFLDESQNIKNPNSLRYGAAAMLKSRNKIVISGTPFENNTLDLYGQLSFACPGLLGSLRYFKDIFLIPIDKFQDRRRTEELQNRIRPFILRRTKAQVALELPDKTEMVLYCEMSAGQRKVYDAYEKEFRDFISAQSNEDLPRSSIHVLKGLTRLRQICNSPLLLNEENLPDYSSSKISTLIEQIMDKAVSHKILVFSQFVSMLDLIRTELLNREIGFSYLTGSTRDREAAVNGFQDNEEVRVFLISLKAGGTGLNLTEANYVFLVDPWWNPAVENQAIDRSYRIGQDKKVIAVRLICPGTIEDKMLQLQQRKKDLHNVLLSREVSDLKLFSREDLMFLLNPLK
ncbi:DEAD/DEAH box helicase [Desertivirga xinjiangensis]|uniref:DEAD/DEAH box helicase n=1 Tax=Desertivirga xinjiangensis TaxID=539206 RepID=UPI00210A8325|nr:DEAD/DEAH box helicase [Pedobacter xinjiangensis]